MSPSERLARKLVVGAGGCLNFTGTAPRGYGLLVVGSRSDGTRRVVRAHRLALELSLGRSLGDGMCACHRCDNTLCCNVAHLFEGTPADNARDRELKMRGNHVRGAHRGEAHHNAKLTAGDVASIARMKGAHSQGEIARMFGVSQTHVSRIHRNSAWKGLV